jgi:hypothetical protein
MMVSLPVVRCSLHLARMTGVWERCMSSELANRLKMCSASGGGGNLGLGIIFGYLSQTSYSSLCTRK